MPLKTRKQIILAKTEVTYGTDPTPTGAANAILAGNVSLTPFEADQVTRNNAQPYLGARPRLHVGKRVRLQFEVELAGSGAAGTAPAFAPLLLACGMDETIVASTSVTYGPISAAEPSVTIWFYQDGQRHKLLGARGTWSLRLAANDYPRLVFDYLGIYDAPAASADPTPDYSAFVAPLEANTTNTPTFSLHSYSAGVLHSLELAYGAALNHRDLVGDTSVEITDREVTGGMVMDAPALGTKDFFAIAAADTLGEFQLVHGTSAGNICTINDAGANVQVMNPRYGDANGNVTLEADLLFLPSSTGNDEIELVFT